MWNWIESPPSNKRRIREEQLRCLIVRGIFHESMVIRLKDPRKRQETEANERERLILLGLFCNSIGTSELIVTTSARSMSVVEQYKVLCSLADSLIVEPRRMISDLEPPVTRDLIDTSQELGKIAGRYQMYEIPLVMLSYPGVLGRSCYATRHHFLLEWIAELTARQALEMLQQACLEKRKLLAQDLGSMGWN